MGAVMDLPGKASGMVELDYVSLAELRLKLADEAAWTHVRSLELLDAEIAPNFYSTRPLSLAALKATLRSALIGSGKGTNLVSQLDMEALNVMIGQAPTTACGSARHTCLKPADQPLSDEGENQPSPIEWTYLSSVEFWRVNRHQLVEYIFIITACAGAAASAVQAVFRYLTVREFTKRANKKDLPGIARAMYPRLLLGRDRQRDQEASMQASEPTAGEAAPGN